jgi:glyoxylase-like metal-dependent hydrolase (beta-lactamase superfamily II)
MVQAIRAIQFPLRLGVINMGTVDCYLLKADSGYMLIDTSFPSKRADLEKELAGAGCQPGQLKLIVITHADLDHIGNAAYLQKKYRAKVAMHRCEAGVVENGDASMSRRRRPFLERIIGGIVFKALSIFFRFGRFERFTPDFCIDDGDDLSAYGFDAKVVHLPGHSRGSIGILTSAGDLFCGDLLWNMGKPGPHSIVDDPAELKASIERLKSLSVQTVYPGHGQPFAMDLFLQGYQPAS